MAGLFDQAKEFASSDKAEELSDQGLDKAAEIARTKTGGDHDEQIDSFRAKADEHIGTE